LPPSVSRMSENVGASKSRNPKGLHGLYKDNFTLPSVLAKLNSASSVTLLLLKPPNMLQFVSGTLHSTAHDRVMGTRELENMRMKATMANFNVPFRHVHGIEGVKTFPKYIC
jgi:hypothetical protein